MLRIPTTPRHFVFLTLEGSDYHMSFMEDPISKRGSVVITQRSVSIAFSKEVQTPEPLGYMGLDVNERNITVSATNGYKHKFEELGEVVEIKGRYMEIRAKIGRTPMVIGGLEGSSSPNMVGGRIIAPNKGYTVSRNE